MKGLGLGIDMIINSYLGDSPLSFNLGTAPTSVLAASGTGDEAEEIRPLQFFEYDATNWGLLYLAKASSSETTRTIKLATSLKSGFAHSWTKQGTVIAAGTGGDWDVQIGSATLAKNGSTWIVLYESFNGGVVGAATGTNLLSLTKHASNPLIDNTASSNFNKYIRHPNTIIVDSTLYCIHEGRPSAANISTASKVGYATAPLSDITDWTISSTVLIEPTDIEYAKSNFSTISNPSINKIGDYYYMWFAAFPTDGTSGAFNDLQIGGISYAYSKDLLDWTIVGTKNYHMYLGLFGYNTSNSFYQNFQEYTPVYDGSNLSLYFWSDTSPDIGKSNLDGASFSNTFRGFELQDSFDDGSINTGIWTNTGGTGITISETGGDLVISKSGTDVQASTTIFESIESWNSDDYGALVCSFTIDVTDYNSTDIWLFELSDAAGTNSDVIRIVRSTTTDEASLVIIVGGVGITAQSFPFTGKDTFKIIISERDRIRVLRSNNTVGYTTLYNETQSIENTDWNFKIRAANSVSSANTIKLKNIAIGEYDRGLVGLFDDTSVLEVISADSTHIDDSETKDFVITGAGFTGCTLSAASGLTINSYEVVSNTHITANITSTGSGAVTLTVDNGVDTDTIDINIIPTNNLVLYNRFNNSLTDETGNHTLSSSGISYTNGLYSGSANESVLFDAAADYVLIPDSNLLSFGDGSTDSSFSISTSIYFDASSGDSQDPILHKRGDNGTSNSAVNREYVIFRRVSDNKLGFNIYDDSTGAQLAIICSTVLSDSTNYHLTFTYDGSGTEAGLKVYVNGVEESYTSNSSGSYTAMENLSSPIILGSLGWTHTGSVNELLGKIDGLGIWNKELSQTEITAIYNKQSGGTELL